jgi:uncharacterized membrane protein
MLYLTLKYFHILLAIFAVGFNASYGLIIARARKTGTDASTLRFALRTVKVMDDYVANPCYVLLGLTGVTMVHLSGLPWSAVWIHGSLALWVLMAILGFGVYTRTLRKQLAVLEARGVQDPEFVRLSKRGGVVGGILGVIALVILGLMVFKPV